MRGVMMECLVLRQMTEVLAALQDGRPAEHFEHLHETHQLERESLAARMEAAELRAMANELREFAHRIQQGDTP